MRRGPPPEVMCARATREPQIVPPIFPSLRGLCPLLLWGLEAAGNLGQRVGLQLGTGEPFMLVESVEGKATGAPLFQSVP